MLTQDVNSAKFGRVLNIASQSSVAFATLRLALLGNIGMPRIAGVMIPDNKRIEIALTYIYGVGRSRSNAVLRVLEINPDLRAGKLGAQDLSRIQNYMDEKYKIGGELRQELTQNIRLLRDIGAYRGTRHQRRLPVRGQRTRTNSRTVRGNVRKTVGSGKRKAEKT